MESQFSEERLKLEQHLAKVCDKNGSGEEARSCITNRLNQICSHFLPHFVHADTLAQKYQNLYTLSSKLIYLLAAVIVNTINAAIFYGGGGGRPGPQYQRPQYNPKFLFDVHTKPSAILVKTYPQS